MDLIPSSIPSHKTRPLNPLIYSRLITSTPDSFQASKRVKCLLGYSEHYKGPRIVNPAADKGFPLKSRDYRNARELTIELWNPLAKGKYLEKFFKSLKGIQNIRIKFLGKDLHRQEDLKQFWKALRKVHWLNRVHLDFDKERTNAAYDSLRITKYLKPLAKLKDLAITVDGEEHFPFSVSLLKVGFDAGINSISVKDSTIIQKGMRRTLKFDQLDTIKINSKNLACFPESFLEGIALVISKLPSFREMDFNFARDIYLPMKPTLNILDTLAKAPKLEILRIGIRMNSNVQILMLKHTIFKAKSLQKIHLSLFISREITPTNLDQILDLLQEMTSLYELSLDFSKYPKINDEIAESLMRKLSELANLRKLKIVFDYGDENLRAKQAGNIIRWIFNKMIFLEELDLKLPKNGIDFAGDNNGGDIQGLPRLTRASIRLRECEVHMEKSVKGVIEILGKCLRLRELELDLTDSVHDFSGSGTPRKLFETLRKLKGLQVLKLHLAGNASASKPQEVLVGMLKDLMVVFGRMRDLQDWVLNTGIGSARNQNEKQEIRDLYDKVVESKKYRFFDFGPSLQFALQNPFYWNNF